MRRIAQMIFLGSLLAAWLHAQRIDLGDRAEGFYSVRITMVSGQQLVRKVAVQR